MLDSGASDFILHRSSVPVLLLAGKVGISGKTTSDVRGRRRSEEDGEVTKNGKGDRAKKKQGKKG